MDEYEKSGGLGKSWVLAAAVVALILVAGAVLIVRNVVVGDDSDPSTRTDKTPQADSSSRCDLPDGPLERLDEPPADVEWELVNTYAAPRTEDAGPAKVTDGAHWCYARSAEGAVVAAANLVTDMSSDEINFETLVDLRIVPSPEADQMASLQNNPDRSQLSQPGLGQIAGFRVDAIDEDSATVQIVFRFSQGPRAGTYYASSTELRWLDGDWRAVATATGPRNAVTLTSLEGYVEWSGA